MTDQEERIELDPVPVEVDGSLWYWFYVCSECRYIVFWKQKRCPHCGRRLDWDVENLH